MLRVSEIFRSIQGEGEFTGTPSLFLRTTGCNLRCWFCDTPYTSWNPEGHQRPWREILKDLLAEETDHVVITGGEPLLQPDVVPLSHALRASGKIVTIETAGTIYREVAADLMSISPKLSNSNPETQSKSDLVSRHAQQRVNRHILHQLMSLGRAQLKFVIDRPADLVEVDAFLGELPQLPDAKIWLMPQARTALEVEEKASWLTQEAQKRGFQLSNRLHIQLWGNIRGV